MQGFSGAAAAMPSFMAPMAAGVQAFGTLGSAIAGSRADSYNAKVADQNAMLAGQTGASQEAASDAQYRSAEGRQLAQEGASGMTMGTGSLLDAIAQSRVQQTFSAMQISRQAQIKAMGYQEESAMDSSAATDKILAGVTSSASGVANTIMQYGTQKAASGFGAASVLKRQVDYASPWNAAGFGAAGALQPFAADQAQDSGALPNFAQ